ncbi:CP4-44 prophage; putative membrane protein [Escherichia coli]|nr:CP4-44 prophage; putative membrane protein [Escherichia coli]
MVLLLFCRETETLCQEIYERPIQQLYFRCNGEWSDSHELPETWSTNEKMFASGGQGHGFAAERGNHIVDRVRLKNARILVIIMPEMEQTDWSAETEIQTKYCSTAARSVRCGIRRTKRTVSLHGK